MDQTYMKKQPVLKLILSMALPMVISMMVSSLYNIVDSFFIAAKPEYFHKIGCPDKKI